ncbi:MAG: hypothetical protein KAJ95_01575 [Gammaproteobacteria bacterium]|nr:hypothetical protein [Gammaproteobacteria bacterium]
MSDTPNIMVGTPAYNSMVHTDYVRSLLGFNMSGLSYSFLSIGGESLITRARNTILAHFHHNKTFTHLFFLDGDVFLDGNDLKKMLDANRDVIGAPVPLKTIEQGKPVLNISGLLGEEGHLTMVERLGNAAMMLSRKAVTALVEDAIKDSRVYGANPLARGIGDSEENYDVFQVGVRDGLYLSEDYWVCTKLRELGFNIYVDLSIRTRHHGISSYGI